MLFTRHGSIAYFPGLNITIVAIYLVIFQFFTSLDNWHLELTCGQSFLHFQKSTVAFTFTLTFVAGLLLPVDACQCSWWEPPVSFSAHSGLSSGLGVSCHQPLHLRVQEQAVPTGICKGTLILELTLFYWELNWSYKIFLNRIYNWINF